MSRTEAIQNKLCYPLIGVVLTLLLTMQLQVGYVFQQTKHQIAKPTKELLLEQGLDAAASQGVLHEVYLSLIATVLLALLLRAFLPEQKIKSIQVPFSLTARYWGCIVPKGP